MSIKSYFKKLFKKKEEPSIILGAGAITTWQPQPLLYGATSYSLQHSYSTAFKQVLEEREKKLEQDRIILNSFDNNVKVLYEDLKNYITNQYSFGFINESLEKDIKVCEILDKHLRNNKFNNKLEDIINE